MKISYFTLSKLLIENNYKFIVIRSPFFDPVEKTVWVFLIPKQLAQKNDCKNTFCINMDGETIRKNWDNYEGEPILHYDINTSEIIASVNSLYTLIKNIKEALKVKKHHRQQTTEEQEDLLKAHLENVFGK